MKILYTFKTLLTSLFNVVIGFMFKQFGCKLFLPISLTTTAKCLNLWGQLHDFVFIIKGIPCPTVKCKNAGFIQLWGWLPEGWAHLTIFFSLTVQNVSCGNCGGAIKRPWSCMLFLAFLKEKFKILSTMKLCFFGSFRAKLLNTN